MTGLPAAFSALAFASTARVADSEMADTRADILVVGMLPWWHLRDHDHQLVSPSASFVGATAQRRVAQAPGNVAQAAENGGLCNRACTALQRVAAPGEGPDARPLR